MLDNKVARLCTCGFCNKEAYLKYTKIMVELWPLLTAKSFFRYDVIIKKQHSINHIEHIYHCKLSYFVVSFYQIKTCLTLYWNNFVSILRRFLNLAVLLHTYNKRHILIHYVGRLTCQIIHKGPEIDYSCLQINGPSKSFFRIKKLNTSFPNQNKVLWKILWINCM